MLPTMMLNKPYLQGEMAAASPFGTTAMLPAASAPSVVPSQLMYCYAPFGVSDPAAYSQLSALQSYHHQQSQLQQEQLSNAVAARSLATQMQQYQSAAGLQQLSPYHMPFVFQQPTVAYVPADQMYMTTGGKKRSSDEVFANSGVDGCTVNGEIINDAKKPRLDQNSAAKPSRVLHFRGVPSDATESEMIQLCLPFGSITNLVLAKKKNQALVEMADISYAQAAVNFYGQKSPIVRGHVIYVQYSNHDQLVTEVAAQGSSPPLGGGVVGSVFNGGDAQGMSLSASVVNLSDATTDEPRTVLRVIVENMVYAIGLDTLKQIFSRFGPVLKIVTFSKNGSFQALIQFPDAHMAQAAKMSLNGQNIFNGCNGMRVDYSKLPELNVRFNNDKSYDYTNPLLPSGDGAPPAFDHRSLAVAQSSMSPTVLSTNLLQPYGPIVAYAPTSSGHKVQLIHPSVLSGSASLTTQGILLTATAPTTTVLLVSNLCEEKVTPDALFTLFGVYGDVVRVKIMFNKQDSALVQFTDAMQAHTAMMNLDKLKLWGKPIKVTPSKHSNVQMPKEGQPDAGLTKDYTNSPLHRFKKPHSKNYNNIFPPSTTLHLSNIPSTSKEKLVELFSKYGTVLGFKFFQKDCKMALLQMSSVEEAAVALVGMHNFQLAETCHLRVSFSKSSVIPQGQDIEQPPYDG